MNTVGSETENILRNSRSATTSSMSVHNTNLQTYIAFTRTSQLWRCSRTVLCKEAVDDQSENKRCREGIENKKSIPDN